ncbi:MAG: beta-galactosidase trimerization domain-containing protein [Limnochordia bacterium]|nr:beta-galactosidase trimerization domain-containing protein [Limnochordia bacterium]
MGRLRFRQVHLDFHTSEKIVKIGTDFDADLFAQTLEDANVDSITCFARCHHGMIYYDTKFAEARHPGLEIDLLEEQIKACHKRNIKVPIYISVGLDEHIAVKHPEWRELSVDGRLAGAKPLEAGWHKLCLNTPYIDYVLDQTKEVLDLFNVDGLFFDIIHQGQCLCKYCLSGMIEAGLDPDNAGDRSTYARSVLAAFQRRMTNMIRQFNKDCTIFYNAGHVSPRTADLLDTYTHLELESLPSGGWGYEHFPITVRYAKNLGVEYLGMTGKFHKSWADFGAFKNEAALQYECFNALANGAKCSIGDQLHPSGRLDPVTYDLISGVYKEVAAKEPWCDDASAATEIGLFTPEAIGRSQGRIDPALAGAYRMLIESHYQFDVIDQRTNFDQYKVIIFPDKIVFDGALQDKTTKYLANGGKLILSYQSGMDQDLTQFMLDMGANYQGELPYSPDYVKARPKFSSDIPETAYVMYDQGLAIKLTSGQVLAELWQPYFNRTWRHFCSHRHTPVEKKMANPAVVKNDNIIYFVHPIFSMYKNHGVRVYKQMVRNALGLLYPHPLIKTNAPTTANITLNWQEAKQRHVVHILHYIPERRSSIDTIEDVIPLYNIQLGVKTSTKPKRVYLAPSCAEIRFEYIDGYTSMTVPKIEGHGMIVLEY